MRADQFQLEVAPRSAEFQLDAQARAAVVGGDQPHVRAVGSTKSDQLAAREPRLLQDTRVVGVGHRDARGAQRVEQLALGMRHSVERAAAFQVHRPDVGDQRHVGIGPRGEPRDLPEMVHAALDGGVAVLLAEAQQRERHAHLVVQVPFRLERGALCREHLGDQLLGRRLASRPGDAREAQAGQPAAPGRREPSQRAPGVGGGEERRAGRHPDLLRSIGRNERAGRAALQRLRDEVGGVEPLAPQRDEEALGQRLPRIGEDALEGSARGDHSGARRPRRLLQREARAHRRRSREMACSARRASARSSKGRFSLPTIW